MHGKIAIVLSSGLLFACVQPPPPPPPAAAQPAFAVTAQPAPAAAPMAADRFVPIRGVPCERMLQLSNEDRAAAAMFYMGYQASRREATAINVPYIPSMVALAINYCSTYPDRPATEAFAYAYATTRRR